MTNSFYTKTLQVKVKSGIVWLNTAAVEVNQVWNYAAALSEKALKPCAGKPKALSGFDLNYLVAVATHQFEKIGSGTILRLGIQLPSAGTLSLCGGRTRRALAA